MDSSGNLYGTTYLRRRLERRHGFRAVRGRCPAGFADQRFAFLHHRRASQTVTVTVPNAVGTTDTAYAGSADVTSNGRTTNPIANDTAPDMGTSPFGGVVPQKKGKSSITDAFFSSMSGGVSADGS